MVATFLVSEKGKKREKGIAVEVAKWPMVVLASGRFGGVAGTTIGRSIGAAIGCCHEGKKEEKKGSCS